MTVHGRAGGFISQGGYTDHPPGTPAHSKAPQAGGGHPGGSTPWVPSGPPLWKAHSRASPDSATCTRVPKIDGHNHHEWWGCGGVSLGGL